MKLTNHSKIEISKAGRLPFLRVKPAGPAINYYLGDRPRIDIRANYCLLRYTLYWQLKEVGCEADE